MSVMSFRYRAVRAKLRPFFEAEQPTIYLPASRLESPETDWLPRLELFYRIEQAYPLMKVARAIERWMEFSAAPLRCIGLSHAVVGGYWQTLRLSVYYHRQPDGCLWVVELYSMDIPDNIVYCCAKRW